MMEELRHPVIPGSGCFSLQNNSGLLGIDNGLSAALEFTPHFCAFCQYCLTI